MRESEILNEIIRALYDAGYQVFRVNVGRVKTFGGRIFSTGVPKGHSDLYGFRPDGQIFYIEVKAGKNKPTPEQVKFLVDMRCKGALTGVAYNVDEALRIVRGEAHEGDYPDE